MFMLLFSFLNMSLVSSDTQINLFYQHDCTGIDSEKLGITVWP